MTKLKPLSPVLALTLSGTCLLGFSFGFISAAHSQVVQPSPFMSSPGGSPANIPGAGAEAGTIPQFTPLNPAELKPPITKQENIITLVRAFDEALLNHPRVASVRATLGIAKASYAQALTFPNPSFLLYNGMRAEQTYQVGASIPIEGPWRVATRLLVAKRQVKETDLQIMNALWLLRNDVRRAYLEVVVAQETRNTLLELAELSGTLLNVAEKRFQAGDVPELDVLKARLALSLANIEFQQSDRRLVRAKQQLAIMLGRDFEDVVEVAKLPSFQVKVTNSELLPDFDKTVLPLRDFVSRAFDNRLELKITAQQIKTYNARLKAAMASIIPNTQLNIGNSITGNPPTGPKIKNGYFLGITQELPLGNFQQADIAEFRARIKQYKYEQGAQKNIITQEVTAAYQRMLAAREKIRSYQEKVLGESDEVARLARRSYEVGQSDITATLQVQQSNIQIRSQYLEAVQAYQQAFTDLEQSVGQTLI